MNDATAILEGGVGLLLALGTAVIAAASVWLATRTTPVGWAHPGPRAVRPGTLLIAGSPPSVLPVFAPGNRARLLVYWTPGCAASRSALGLVSAHASTLAAFVDVYAVRTAPPGEQLPERESRLPEAPAIDSFDLGGEVADALALGAARPVAVLISTEGNPIFPLAAGLDLIAELLGLLAEVASPHPSGQIDGRERDQIATLHDQPATRPARRDA